MYTVVTILIIITCILLTLVVMVQNAKGGGLASGFVSSGQIMGVQKTTDFIEKLTWGLAIALVVLCLVASLALPSNQKQNIESVVGTQMETSGQGAPSQATPPPVTPPVENPPPGSQQPQ